MVWNSSSKTHLSITHILFERWVADPRIWRLTLVGRKEPAWRSRCWVDGPTCLSSSRSSGLRRFWPTRDGRSPARRCGRSGSTSRRSPRSTRSSSAAKAGWCARSSARTSSSKQRAGQCLTCSQPQARSSKQRSTIVVNKKWKTADSSILPKRQCEECRPRRR